MIGRIILALIFIGSLIWIGVVGFDILSVKSNYAPQNTFGLEDKQVLVVNRPSEVQFELLEGLSDSPIADLISKLDVLSYTKGYFSFKRSHFILKTSENWTKENITSLFGSSELAIEFNGSKFSLGEFNGNYFKSSLYVYKELLESTSDNLTQESFQIDNKSSASIIEIGEDNVKSVSDIYFLPIGKINYVSSNDENVLGNQVTDEVVFSHIVTSKFSKYHFIERDYLTSKDSVFAKGPMSQWCLNGVLEIDYKGSRVLITDYIDGQDPILILNDLFQSVDASSFKVPLTNDFPSKNKSFHIKYLEDLVVISESENACDKVIGDFKLGNTIALNQNVFDMVYGRLPKSISERFVSEKVSYSKSVFKDKILQTQFGNVAPVTVVQQVETISINCGFDIADFIVLKGNGNVIVQGSNGELVAYKNEEPIWKLKIEDQIVGEVQLIDLYYNGEMHLLFNTEDKIHLYNMKGLPSSGFPISLELEATNEVKFYRWLGKSYFLIGVEESQILKYDGEGRELDMIQATIPVNNKIDVWASQGKLFGGFSYSKEFEMYNLEKNVSHRVFDLPSQTKSAKITNELIQFAMVNNQLIKIDQKGEQFQFRKYENGKILSVNNSLKNPTVIVRSNNILNFVNHEGVSYGEIKLGFNEIEDVTLYSSISGRLFVAVLDGLENNVYLYNTTGEKIKRKPLEGQTKVSVVMNENGTQISTVIDQFFVQYFE